MRNVVGRTRAASNTPTSRPVMISRRATMRIPTPTEPLPLAPMRSTRGIRPGAQQTPPAIVTISHADRAERPCPRRS
jgi:hypothetical protein